MIHNLHPPIHQPPILLPHLQQPPPKLQHTPLDPLLLPNIPLAIIRIDLNPRLLPRRESRISAPIPLHRRPRVIASHEPDAIQDVGHIGAVGAFGLLFVVEIYVFDVAQVVKGPAGVSHGDFLALVDEERAAARGVEEGEHFGGGGAEGGVGGPAGDDPGLVVVFLWENGLA